MKYEKSTRSQHALWIKKLANQQLHHRKGNKRSTRGAGHENNLEEFLGNSSSIDRFLTREHHTKLFAKGGYAACLTMTLKSRDRIRHDVTATNLSNTKLYVTATKTDRDRHWQQGTRVLT